MAGIISSAILADVIGEAALASFLGEAVAGTVLDAAVGGSLAEVGAGLSADAFAGLAAGGSEALTTAAGDGLAGLGAEGSANAFADAAANGADGGGGFDPSKFQSGPYDPPTNASPYAPGEGPTYTGGPGGPGGPGGMGPLSSLAGKLAGPLLGGVAPIAGSIRAGNIGANGARDAANTLAQAGTQAIALQQGMFDKSQANLQPYIDGGTQAMGKLNADLKDGTLGGTFSGADYLANKDPGYQFQLDQGTQALQNSQAAKDGVLSGSALKGLIDYNQGMASTGYQSAYNRWLTSQQNTYGQLAGTAGIGNTAASYGSQSASNFSKSIGDTIVGRGNALASGQVGVANNQARVADSVGNRLSTIGDLFRTSNPSAPANANANASVPNYNGQNNPMNGTFNGPLQNSPNTNGLGPDFDPYKVA